MKQLVFVIGMIFLSGCRLPIFGKNGVGGGQHPANGDDTSDLNAIASQELEVVQTEFEKVMKVPYVQKLADLPIKGVASFVPYSGHYYYENTGKGTDLFGSLAKFDRAFGTDAATWEREHHAIAANDPKSPWSGHCNGWASSAARLGEPPSDVIKNGVTFTRMDIKALLAEIFMSVYSVTLGGNRCKNPTPNPLPFYRGEGKFEKMDECEDINPATFLLGLANMIGRANLPVIFDESFDEQVWNFPVYSYECANCVDDHWLQIEGSDAAKKAKEIVAGYAYGANNTYQFNSKATRWYDIKLNVTYTKGVSASETLDQPTPATKTYRFIVEANESDIALGGEWSFANQKDHPDVVVLPLQPVQGNGDKRYANKEIDPEIVLDLWRESWRIAGKEFVPEGKSYPIWEDAWGEQVDYALTIDGLKSGAAFVSNNNKFNISFKTKRLDGATLRVYLNDELLTETTASQSAISFEKAIPAGANTIRVSWVKDSLNETQEFKVYALY